MFSIIRNGRDLIRFDKNNDLNWFNGVKVSTMILVLFGHKFLYLMATPLMYGRRLEMVIIVYKHKFIIHCLIKSVTNLML